MILSSHLAIVIEILIKNKLFCDFFLVLGHDYVYLRKHLIAYLSKFLIWASLTILYYKKHIESLKFHLNYTFVLLSKGRLPCFIGIEFMTR